MDFFSVDDFMMDVLSTLIAVPSSAVDSQVRTLYGSLTSSLVKVIESNQCSRPRKRTNVAARTETAEAEISKSISPGKNLNNSAFQDDLDHSRIRSALTRVPSAINKSFFELSSDDLVPLSRQVPNSEKQQEPGVPYTSVRHDGIQNQGSYGETAKQPQRQESSRRLQTSSNLQERTIAPVRSSAPAQQISCEGTSQPDPGKLRRAFSNIASRPSPSPSSFKGPLLNFKPADTLKNRFAILRDRAQSAADAVAQRARMDRQRQALGAA